VHERVPAAVRLLEDLRSVHRLIVARGRLRFGGAGLSLFERGGLRNGAKASGTGRISAGWRRMRIRARCRGGPARLVPAIPALEMPTPWCHGRGCLRVGYVRRAGSVAWRVRPGRIRIRITWHARRVAGTVGS
jgi:hypothetical protein